VLSVVGNEKVEEWVDLQLYNIPTGHDQKQEMFKNISRCVCGESASS